MSLFKNQSLFTITCATSYASLASATVKRILYTKPSGTDGYWDATVSGNNLIYIVQSGDIDEEGTWKFQAFVTVSGRDGYGNIAEHYFKYPLQ